MRFTYCPHCGSELTKREIGDEGLVPFCEACKVPLFDMFATCVICAVTNECGEVALLKQGDICKVNALLGFDYHVTGDVIHGRGVGKTLQFPTVNLDYNFVNANCQYSTLLYLMFIFVEYLLIFLSML